MATADPVKAPVTTDLSSDVMQVTLILSTHDNRNTLLLIAMNTDDQMIRTVKGKKSATYLCFDPGVNTTVACVLKLHNRDVGTLLNEVESVEILGHSEFKHDGSFANFKKAVKNWVLGPDLLYFDMILIEKQPMKNYRCISNSFFLYGYLISLSIRTELVNPAQYKRYFNACTGSYSRNKKLAISKALDYVVQDSRQTPFPMSDHVADCILMAVYYFENKEDVSEMIYCWPILNEDSEQERSSSLSDDSCDKPLDGTQHPSIPEYI